jgi:hypothetical protein
VIGNSNTYVGRCPRTVVYVVVANTGTGTYTNLPTSAGDVIVVSGAPCSWDNAPSTPIDLFLTKQKRARVFHRARHHSFALMQVLLDLLRRIATAPLVSCEPKPVGGKDPPSIRGPPGSAVPERQALDMQAPSS